MFVTMIKRNFMINGTLKFVTFEEGDTLADLLRRLGLRSVKIGCNAGQCGSCSVLVDGDVVRSCIKKAKDIKEHSAIETLEGMGTAKALHPLQQAFITYGAVQCGFCTPGFLMSAKALLQVNPNPTRQEVRDWFNKHRNICRCTGYKPIVDSVMAAAAVMRGEASMEDITYHYEEGADIYGTSHPRPGSLAKVLGVCDYGEDFAAQMSDEALHLAVVQAKVHHANILGIEYNEAENMPGVVKVITAADVKGSNILRLIPPLGSPHYYSDGLDHPIICDKKIFRYGDVVAVVAAHTRKQARMAAEKVKVIYEELPAYLTFMEAAAKDAIRVHEQSPNVYIEQPLFKGGDTREIFKTSEYSVEGSFSTTRQPHLPIEPDTAQAYWGEDGVMMIHCKSQNLYGNIAALADSIGLPKGKIRLVQNTVGGSFGYSMSAQMPALVAVCAMATDKPVSLTLSYPEHQHYTGKRSASYTNARLACDKDGKITALEFHMGIDHGAYSDASTTLTTKTIRFLGYPYNVPNIRGLSQMCFSNGNFGIAFRAFGSPQAYMASESLIDMLAAEAGIDPFEFRYINAAREGDLSPNSMSYRNYPMREMLDLMRPYYKQWKEEAKRKNTADKKYGVGVSFGGYHVGKSHDSAEVALELNEDGSVSHYNTWEEMGQGADIGTLAHTYRCLRELNLRPEQIHLVQNDTGTCPNTGSASSSRSHHMAGWATKIAADKLLDAMRKPDGSFRSYSEMIREGIPTKYFGKYESPSDVGHIDKNTGHGFDSVGQNFILNLAEVEVDVKTGKAKVLRYRIVSDIGIVGNRLAVTGQALGGMSHCVGFALTENYEDMKRHGTMAGAGIPSINDIPDDAEVVFNETPREYGPQNSTGCSESYQSSGHVAVLNAIYDATGVRIYTLPATPEKIKEAMNALSRGEAVRQERWDLGCDMFERLDHFEAKATAEKLK
ncbi:molybdopterin cofactor-binding domain-containing protein [Cloacibacillus porcorum]|uniref:molybdopterin-dependent oxidoreductase n=2 Tax=Cloacibacillus porcorum TaxID=1197717 RepID=UPI002A813910|nr:molybdopterin cofactor-binding domain-containing protein [Cloacibacillus porcorum]MDY4093485.1 molybdopterin cofactor-binding domain-containing protein [Cloacibacillus porcorum]